MSRQKADTGTLSKTGRECTTQYVRVFPLYRTVHRTPNSDEYVSQNSQCELSLIGTSLYFASNFIFLYSSTTTTVLSSSTHIA